MDATFEGHFISRWPKHRHSVNETLTEHLAHSRLAQVYLLAVVQVKRL